MPLYGPLQTSHVSICQARREAPSSLAASPDGPCDLPHVLIQGRSRSRRASRPRLAFNNYSQSGGSPRNKRLSGLWIADRSGQLASEIAGVPPSRLTSARFAIFAARIIRTNAKEEADADPLLFGKPAGSLWQSSITPDQAATLGA